MKAVYGIIFGVVILWLLGMILILAGCAGAPLTYEQRVAVAAAGAGLRQFGDEMRYGAMYNPYRYPQYIQPLPPVQPLVFPQYKPAPLIPHTPVSF